MSIWNRIGDLASNAAKFGGEVVGAAAAPARFAWDIGTAPWNDDEEYNGFVQPFKTAAAKASGDIVKPLASAGGAIMKVPGVAPALETLYKVNQEAIREPLTTYFLMRNEVMGGNVLGFFDPNTWEKAYKGAQEISFGQAFVSPFRYAFDPQFNIYDPREREAAFEKSAWGKYSSGGVDVFAQLFGDISLAGGKAAKVLKASQLGVGKLNNADAVAKAAEDITKAQYGVNNRFTKVLKDFTDNNSTYAISHPMVKSSSNPGLLAHLLGDSVDIDETALILRSALGDPKALNNLRAQRVHISDALEAERGKLSAVDEFKLFAAPDGSGMLPFLNDSPAVTEEALNNYRSLAATDKYFADLMEVGKGGGALTRTTGLGLQGVEDFVAKSRATKFYDKKVGNARIDIYQPTPFHVLYQKFSWSQKERPAGWVDFNDPDSYREVIATVNRLEKRANLTPVESKKLLDGYLGASTPEAKFTATLNLEGAGLRALAKKYDVDEEFADDLYNNYKRARTSATKSIKDKGFMVDNDGTVIRVPQLESQTANFLPLMDFDVMDDLLKRNASAFKLIGTTKNRVFNSLDFVQDAFKAAVLLRLGYTIRNTVDSSLRIASSVGAYAQLRHLGPGLKNVITDKVATPSRLIDRYRAVDAGMTFAQVQKSANKVTNELNDLKTRISATEAKVSLNPDDLDLAGELNTLKLLQEEKQAVYQHYADVLNRSPKAQPKQSIGTGSYRVTTSDGQVYDLDDALGGPLGDMFKRIASSGNSFQRMVDSNTDLYKRNLESKGIGAVKPTDPAYFEEWARTLRTQFGNSVVVNKIVAGETVDDITRWLKSSVDGRDLRRRLAINSDNAAEYVTKISGFLDNYLPVSSNLRDKIRTVTAEDLRSTFKDPTTLPIIHGHILKENFNNISEIQKKGIINSLFKLLATMPEDAFARNPLFVHLYRQEAKRRINIMSGLKDDIIGLDEQRVIMDQARKVALREMKGILFNIERKTNLATAMKYINPFFSAQENAYKTWMKLAVADPSLVNRGYLVWQAPNRLGLVTDENGEQVPVGKTSGSDTIWLDLPKGITNIPGLEHPLTKMGISKGSLDIIFQGGLDALYNQGNPNIVADIFPVGPYVGVTVSALTKDQPTVQESIKGMFPYGIPKNLGSAFLPPWLQRQITANAELEDPQFARSYQLIWKTEQQNAKRDGRPAVKPEKIMDMTKDYWRMRTFASLIMPFAPRFDSPYQYYLNKSREYKRIYGLDADAKFLQDYPEYFAFSASLSKNPTGIQSSTVAAENTKKYSGLISELSNINPRLIGLVTNDPTGYDFSQAAYNFLFRKKVSPGSPDKFLSSLSPQESQRQNDAEKGWIQYNKLSDAIDNELQKRGLSSTQQTGAEDLAFLKAKFIEKLSRRTDAEGKPIFDNKTGQYEQTAWADDYLDSDGSKTNKVILGLSAILQDETFMKDNKNNPTWKSVSAYLDIRKAIAQNLLRRDVKSIEAKANADLKFIYDGMVNKLKQDDKLGFAYLYDRFLSQDLILDKYLTPKVGE